MLLLRVKKKDWCGRKILEQLQTSEVIPEEKMYHSSSEKDYSFSDLFKEWLHKFFLRETFQEKVKILKVFPSQLFGRLTLQQAHILSDFSARFQ